MPRLYLKTPSSARERAIFSPGKDGEAGDVCSIVDAAGCSQVEKGPLEARSSFQTEPNFAAPCEQIVAVIMHTVNRRVNSFLGGQIPSSRRISKTALAARLSAGGWAGGLVHSQEVLYCSHRDWASLRTLRISVVRVAVSRKRSTLPQDAPIQVPIGPKATTKIQSPWEADHGIDFNKSDADTHVCATVDSTE